MRLYVLDGGRVHLPDKNHLTPDRNVGVPVTIPILMFLIDHPKGLVVFDTGIDTDAGAARHSWRPRPSDASTGRCGGWAMTRPP